MQKQKINKLANEKKTKVNDDKIILRNLNYQMTLLKSLT